MTPETGPKANTLSAHWPSTAILTLACLACLAPFAGKAFHIDDPLFLWTAQQIQKHPRDFFGFQVDWYYYPMRMSDVTKNPPLASYYIALVASVFGWSEISLHLAFLLPAWGAILGTYTLAGRFGARPLFAALVTLLTPGFLLSSTTIMCDTLMLCFWIWAVVLWDYGLGCRRTLPLAISGLLIGLSFLTKYFGISLVPLLAVYTLMYRPEFFRGLVMLLIPIVVVVAYGYATSSLYHKNLFLEAVDYANKPRSGKRPTMTGRTVTSLAFVGACTAAPLFFTPLLWSRRTIVAGLLLIGLFAALLYKLEAIGRFELVTKNEVRWPVIAQLAIWAATGVAVIGLAAVDVQRHRDPHSVLLLLWVLGTWCFTAFLNWTVNGRSILPLAPAVGILLARRIQERHGDAANKRWGWRQWWPLVPAGGLALVATGADYALASAARTAAVTVHESVQNPNHALYFEGHWGFQYYMEGYGGRALDVDTLEARAGDALVIPMNNTNRVSLPAGAVAEKPAISIDGFPGLTTMNAATGAGFYDSGTGGPLPFCFGRSPPEEYRVFEFARPFRFPSRNRPRD